MNAYETGKKEAGTRKDRYRKYETDKSEKAYWNGYIDGMKAKLIPGFMLVQCEREGTMFITQIEDKTILCPTCGRLYALEDGHYESDRRLTIIYRKTKDGQAGATS